MLSQMQARATPGQPPGAGSAFRGAPARAHIARDLELLFAQCFDRDFNTQLEGGAREPLYEPATPGDNAPARIVYREDFFASALHEVAHWCLAGEQRRAQVDYGYWYAPDGRDEQAQRRFEEAEKKPQALEWVFSVAAGFAFQVSMDNLESDVDTLREKRFMQAVLAQAIDYCTRGLPARAAVFTRALVQLYFPRLSTGALAKIPEHLLALQDTQGK